LSSAGGGLSDIEKWCAPYSLPPWSSFYCGILV